MNDQAKSESMQVDGNSEVRKMHRLVREVSARIRESRQEGETVEAIAARMSEIAGKRMPVEVVEALLNWDGRLTRRGAVVQAKVLFVNGEQYEDMQGGYVSTSPADALQRVLRDKVQKLAIDRAVQDDLLEVDVDLDAGTVSIEIAADPVVYQVRVLDSGIELFDEDDKLEEVAGEIDELGNFKPAAVTPS